jgi:uncharacterized membrane protein YozB (DUF420 family)
MIQYLPHVNASLNVCAAALLLLGFAFIKRRNISAHRRTMLTCFGVSILFLISYLVYHANVGSKSFPQADYPAWVRVVYLSILASHTLLAAIVPWLAIRTIYLGLRDRRAEHRRWARWTFPIWLYVSVTGVLVYAMLYWLFPPISAVK